MRAVLLIFILCLGWVAAIAQPKWVLKKDEDGIKVYTATAINSAFKLVKAECTVTATLTQFAAFVMDIEKQPSWVYSTRSARLLKKIGSNEIHF